MKILKIIAVISALILITVVMVFVTLPFRFPNSIIYWQGILIYACFLLCLSLLPLFGLILSLGPIRKLLVVMAIGSILLVGLGFAPLILELIFIAGLLILYFSLSKLPKNEKTI
ncbi:MAG: hypothetical protein M1282_12970 [Chloroflexi bacterium]|nr:hypothetical protein [Chloroflexota bacterium]